MATWRERLLPASFRGVAFEALNDSTPLGNRVQIHEYPQRDEPYVERLGRRVRTYRITGFLSGPDCFDKRDALEQAIHAAGAGELVHPWYGRRTVEATDECEITHSREEGGLVRLTLVFVDAGKLVYPSEAINTAQQLGESARSALDSALDVYRDAMAQLDSARLAANQVRRTIDGVYNVINRNFNELAAGIGSAERLFDSIIKGPQHLIVEVQT